MVISPALCRNHLKGTRISFSNCTVDIACDNHWRAMLIKTKGQFFRKRDWIRPNTILCSANFDLYHIYIYMYWLYHFEWLINLLVEVLHDVIRDRKQFSSKTNMAVGRHIEFVDYRALQSEYKCHHCTQHGRKPPFRHITRPFKSV